MKYIFALVLVSLLAAPFEKYQNKLQSCTFTMKGTNIFISNFSIHRVGKCHLHFLFMIHATVMLEVGGNLFLYVTICNKAVLIWTRLAWHTTPSRHTLQEAFFICWVCTSCRNVELIFKRVRGCCFSIMRWMRGVVFAVIKFKDFLAFLESMIGILLREGKNYWLNYLHVIELSLPVFKPWRTRYESVNYGIRNYWST